MDRYVSMPLFGYVSVFGVVFALGGFEGVSPLSTLLAFLIGAGGVFGIVAGISFGRGYRDSDDADRDEASAEN
ncbi:hypothetical protein [Halobaculum sp. D14]|uniref:hypothetical protein n=1 Tax=Halobaculum sp. D14 TaxID=3421642 RepID=UPI003EBBBCFD